MTKEQFFRNKTHKVVNINQDTHTTSYAIYEGTAGECVNIINARMTGVWAVVTLTDEEKESLWNVYRNKE